MNIISSLVFGLDTTRNNIVASSLKSKRSFEPVNGGKGRCYRDEYHFIHGFDLDTNRNNLFTVFTNKLLEITP